MVYFNKKLIKEILTNVKTDGIYGYELFKALKIKIPDLNQPFMYSIFKNLQEKNFIEMFISAENNHCKVKTKYKLLEKGKNFIKCL